MDFTQARQRMVDEQIASREIRDDRVLSAMLSVERHQFVPTAYRHLAYSDQALSIGAGQTISQPFIVATMVDALQLKGSETVLEIGTGSGYGAAVLGQIAARVITIERIDKLATRARHLLRELGYDNITVIAGDGTQGCQTFAPYDAIVVTAGGPALPKALGEQLKIGGRLVAPVGPSHGFQTLVRQTKISDEKFREDKLCEVRFVPLVRD